jgi:hypothetical protein
VTDRAEVVQLLGQLGLSPPPPWQPRVEQRRHPFGEQGVRSSLEEVAKRAAQQIAHLTGDAEKLTRVKTWAGKKIHEAKRRGQNVSSDRARAEVVLRAIQTEKVWVPDPVGVEHMVGAHLMACDTDADNPEGVCIQAEDCDGLVILCGACFLAIGLHTAIVGHAYDQGKHIQHVICSVKIDGEWLYADPSYDYQLGKCHPFTRERVITIPNMKVICDASSCLRELSGYDPEQAYVEKGNGMFIGVDGAPIRRVSVPIDLFWFGLTPPRKST